MLRNYRFCIFCGLAAALIALLLGLPSSARAEEAVSFIRDVAPILKENCFACHDAKKKSGKYDMTTFEKLMAGGEDGEAITPGKPEESEFYTLIVTDEMRRMPPRDKGRAVPKDQAAILKKWIAQGAKRNAELDAKSDLVAELRRRWVPPAPPKEFPRAIPVNALAFSADDKHLFVSGHHEITVWEVSSGKLVKRLRTRSERAYGLAILPNGWLAVAGGRPGQEGDLRFYDVSQSAETLDGVNDKSVLVKHLFDTDDSILFLSLSADGTKLAAGGTDRLVRIWDVADPAQAKLDQTIDNHADWVLGAAFSADGSKLFTAGRDRTAKVWDLTKKQSILTMPEHQAIVYGVAVKADGSLGFSVGADKMLRAWKPNADSKPNKNGGAHTDEVFKIVAHPKKNVLFTAGADKVVRSWDATDKYALLKRFEGAKDVIYALALSSDGSMVAVGSYDGEVRIWKSDDAKFVASFQSTPGLGK